MLDQTHLGVLEHSESTSMLRSSPWAGHRATESRVVRRLKQTLSHSVSSTLPGILAKSRSGTGLRPAAKAENQDISQDLKYFRLRARILMHGCKFLAALDWIETAEKICPPHNWGQLGRLYVEERSG